MSRVDYSLDASKRCGRNSAAAERSSPLDHQRHHTERRTSNYDRNRQCSNGDKLRTQGPIKPGNFPIVAEAKT